MMKKSAMTGWEVFVLLSLKFAVTQQSITGMTYHDELNFEEKYRNIHECDPFYWHPLHLPEQCAEMYAKLIRSRVATAFGEPVRIVSRRGKPRRIPSRSPKYLESYYDQSMYETDSYGNNNYNLDDYPYEEQEEIINSMSPYYKMLEYLRLDISKNPTAPVIGMSNYGPIAMYKQPISKQSETVIKQLAQAYARANQVASNNEDGYYYGKIEIPSTPTSDKPTIPVDQSMTTNKNAEWIQHKKIKLNNKKSGIHKSKKTKKGLTIQ